VRVTREPDRVEVEVTDDGRGAVPVGAPAPDGGGHGLRGMRERARAVGGTLAAGPVAGGGWRVLAPVPVGAAGPSGAVGPEVAP
jgi:signal transduction histidine kinase